MVNQGSSSYHLIVWTFLLIGLSEGRNGRRRGNRLGRYHYMATTSPHVPSKLKAHLRKPNYVLLQLSNLSISKHCSDPKKNLFDASVVILHEKKSTPRALQLLEFSMFVPRLSYHQNFLPPMTATHTQKSECTINIPPPNRYYKQQTSIAVRFRFELPIYRCFPHTFSKAIL